MKFCTNCGAEIAENAKFCSKCGHKIEGESEKQEFFKYIEDEEANKLTNQYYGKSSIYQRGKNYSTSTLTGILSVILSALNYLGLPITHLIGIVLGIVTLVLVEKDKYELKEHSKAGFVLGIIGIVLGVLAIIIGIILIIVFPELVA